MQSCISAAKLFLWWFLCSKLLFYTTFHPGGRELSDSRLYDHLPYPHPQEEIWKQQPLFFRNLRLMIFIVDLY